MQATAELVEKIHRSLRIVINRRHESARIGAGQQIRPDRRPRKLDTQFSLRLISVDQQSLFKAITALTREL